MTQNMKLTDGEFQVALAPWVQQFMEAKAAKIHSPAVKVAAPIMDQEYHEQQHCNHNPTDPIYLLEDVERFKQFFLTRKGHKNVNIRDYAYFVFSLNMSRRAGDILHLHVYDVLNPDGSFKTHVTFEHEQKTGKKSIVLLNSKARDALAMYFNSLDEYRMSDWLFPNSKKPDEPMSVDGMRRMLQRATKALGIDMHMGTHSLRKTNPYHMISSSTNTQDEVMVSQLLKHNDIKTTYHYIKRSQAQMDAFVESHGL